MKANEAPERLYLSETIYSTYLYQVPDPDDESAVEYTQTDAFIKKASKWIIDNFPTVSGISALMYADDFKNYMKGE